ncbi:catalase [Streptomyces sp. NPDC088387]|uniref:catalase n=1 Tax=Streptomyces sp. NPDC088387 TaxID=3365859 RepID=UPI00380FCC6B
MHTEPYDGSVTADGMTATQAIERIEAANRPRRQDRRLHARGAVYAAEFTPSEEIARWTTATHLTSPSEAVIRFSNGSGRYDADDRTRGVRGMAVKFLEDGKAVTDLVAATFRVFPSSTPEGFVELVEALAEANSGTGKGKVLGAGKVASVLARRPESRDALKGFLSKPPQASFATTRFDGLHAFTMIDADGKRQSFRYRLVPELGEVDLDPEYARTLAADFLIADLDARLKETSVGFTLVFQLAEPGDPTHDPSQAWPEHRRLLVAGRIVVTGRSPQEDQWQQHVFDPTRLAAGLEVSDDRVLAFRPHAYGVSAAHRHEAG